MLEGIPGGLKDSQVLDVCTGARGVLRRCSGQRWLERGCGSGKGWGAIWQQHEEAVRRTLVAKKLFWKEKLSLKLLVPETWAFSSLTFPTVYFLR